MKYMDIADKAKPYVKKDRLHLYRAFLPKSGEQIILNTDGELFFFTPNMAIQNLINRDTVDIVGKLITVMDIEFSVKEIQTMELGTDHIDMETGSVGIILDKLPIKEMHMKDSTVAELNVEQEPNTEIKKIIDIVLEDIGA